MSKNKLERMFLPVLILVFVFLILASTRAYALVRIVSTYIDMIGNSIYNVGYMNITGWLNGTYFNGTYYGDGSNLQSISTFNASYDSKISYNTSWNETRADAMYLKFYTETDPRFEANFSVFNPFYNQTAPAISAANAYTDAKIAATQATFLPYWIMNMSSPVDAGDINSILVAEDSNSYNVSEVLTNPPIDERINFTNVNSTFNKITMRVFYYGSATHEIYVQLWNWQTSQWVNFGAIANQNDFFYVEVNVPNMTAYNNSGNVSLRLLHSDGGWASHKLYIDYVSLRFDGSGVSISSHDSLLGRDSETNHPWAMPKSTAYSTFANQTQVNTSWNETRANALYLPKNTNLGANVSTKTCSGTDKVSGINNATGEVTCSADEIGGSTPVVVGQPVVVRQMAQLSTSSNTVWSATDLKFNVVADNKYTMVCDILFTGAVATTGQAINLSANFTSSNVNIMYDTWSSATASVGFSATTFGTALIGTGSGAAVIRPNLVIADFDSTSDGTVEILIMSEVGGSNTIMERGSKCELYNRTAYTLTPVSNATGRYPATLYQNEDVSTTSNTVWSPTQLNFTLENGKNYNLVCDILFTGAVATTGQAINLSANFTSSNVNIMYDTWSSATASVGFSATTFGTALIGTGSGAAVIRPNLVIADFTTTSAGELIFQIRSEISASATTLKKGSTCRLYDMS